MQEEYEEEMERVVSFLSSSIYLVGFIIVIVVVVIKWNFSSVQILNAKIYFVVAVILLKQLEVEEDLEQLQEKLLRKIPRSTNWIET